MLDPAIDYEKDPVFQLYREYKKDRDDLQRSYIQAWEAYKQARNGSADAQELDGLNRAYSFDQDQYNTARQRFLVAERLWKAHSKYLLRLTRKLGLESLPDLP